MYEGVKSQSGKLTRGKISLGKYGYKLDVNTGLGVSRTGDGGRCHIAVN